MRGLEAVEYGHGDVHENDLIHLAIGAAAVIAALLYFCYGILAVNGGIRGDIDRT